MNTKLIRLNKNTYKEKNKRMNKENNKERDKERDKERVKEKNKRMDKVNDKRMDKVNDNEGRMKKTIFLKKILSMKGSNMKGGKVKFTSISNSKYEKKNKSIQDNMSREDILKKLVGYKSLKTIEEKRILEKLPIFKVWVRYYNIDTRKFRVGGLLSKVSYPDYIMLANPSKNLTWSVQLNNNIIYIKDPKEIIMKMGDNIEKKRINLLKDKLYDLYNRGLLVRKS